MDVNFWLEGRGASGENVIPFQFRLPWGVTENRPKSLGKLQFFSLFVSLSHQIGCGTERFISWTRNLPPMTLVAVFTLSFRYSRKQVLSCVTWSTCIECHPNWMWNNLRPFNLSRSSFHLSSSTIFSRKRSRITLAEPSSRLRNLWLSWLSCVLF